MTCRYWSPRVDALSPYVPGEQPQQGERLIKLNTNENPYPPSPEVANTLAAYDVENLRLYPDPDARELRKSIADYYDVGVEDIFVGNGSDEVLAHSFMAFFKQKEPILFPDVTYSFYTVYCALYDIHYKALAVHDDFTIGLEAYSQSNGGIIIPNPNAPTGIGLSLNQVEQLLKKNRDSVVIIDEAYVDFGGVSVIPLIKKYDNLLVIQTFSKSRNLAGMRVGFAVGNQQLIDGLERVKNSFNSYPLDTLAQAVAMSAIKDDAYFKKVCAMIIASRDLLAKRLESFGFEVLPSESNFLFVTHPEHKAESLYAGLKSKGVLVRHFAKPRINAYLRITVGKDEENAALCDALELILK